MKHKDLFFFWSLLIILSGCSVPVDPPAPYGATPSPKQLHWQKLEYYMFVHFGPNTFTDVEWGDGKEDPKVFNPTDLDCRQWAATAKAAGMKGIIITAKHHDGFCLWPSQYSTHTVRESLWKDGKGDLLKELSEACKEYGLKFGVYLSPWDQNHPTYGTEAYNEVFANTLTEVLTGYGEVFEQWFDGANGDAHKGTRQEYDWALFHETVYSNQPQALIFSDVGPDCRWMGNERGIAGETNWSTLNVRGFAPGLEAPPSDTLNSGNRHGEKWVPAETDVSIRPGWFYSPNTDDKVKTLEHLVDIYYTSIGRNSNLLLNVPPSREGKIHPNDSTRLMEFRKIIDESFDNDLLEGAGLKASNTRGRSSTYKAEHLLNTDFDTYWATDDDVLTASIEITLPENKTFNRFLIQEYIPLGQRIAAFTLEKWDESTNNWVIITEGTTIGYKRILRFPMVTARRLRLQINEALAGPVLNHIALYKAPEFLSMPLISRDKEGMVRISCSTPDPVIYYTTDRSTPTVNSPKYQQPFPFAGGGTVQAIAAIGSNDRQSESVTISFDIAPAKWRIVSQKQEDAVNAIDGNPNNRVSINHTQPLIIDLGELLSLKGFVYTPVHSVNASNIYRYNFYVSTDNQRWTKVKDKAVFNNIQNNPIRQEVLFDQAVEGQYIKIEAIETVNPGMHYTISEISIITR